MNEIVNNIKHFIYYDLHRLLKTYRVAPLGFTLFLVYEFNRIITHLMVAMSTYDEWQGMAWAGIVTGIITGLYKLIEMMINKHQPDADIKWRDDNVE